MPKIRLNKAVKEFNISMSRLVEFLQSKDIVVENNPNAQLEEAAYSALEAEFAKDGEQRKASHEVVITKVPEEKLEIEKAPEVIRAKANKPETRILGKIDLEPKKPEAVEEVPSPTPAPVPVEEKKEVVEEVKEVAKEEPKVVSETKPAPEKQEFKVLDKIDLSQIEGNRNRPAKRDKPKSEEVKTEVKTETLASATTPAKKSAYQPLNKDLISKMANKDGKKPAGFVCPIDPAERAQCDSCQ